MTNRIISIIEAIDALCNIGILMGVMMFLYLFVHNLIFKIDSDFGKIFYTARAICILGVIFIPNKETLLILFSK